jgi:hypothetical protein
MIQLLALLAAERLRLLFAWASRSSRIICAATIDPVLKASRHRRSLASSAPAGGFGVNGRTVAASPDAR